MRFHLVRAVLAVAIPLLILSFGPALAAPLDKVACQKLREEQAELVKGGIKEQMAKGAEWAKANLKPDQISQIKRYITVEEQIAFRCREKPATDPAAAKAKRLAYYDYIASGPRPCLTLIQDLENDERGLGAFWGEVQSNVHKGLGCAGVITDGSVRDLDQWADGFFVLAGSVMPSHVWADLVDIDVPVTVAGMAVKPGDLIHADKHGAVVVPESVAGAIPAAAALIAKREAVLIGAAREPGFSMADLHAAFAKAADIH